MNKKNIKTISLVFLLAQLIFNKIAILPKRLFNCLLEDLFRYRKEVVGGIFARIGFITLAILTSLSLGACACSGKSSSNDTSTTIAGTSTVEYITVRGTDNTISNFYDWGCKSFDGQKHNLTFDANGATSATGKISVTIACGEGQKVTPPSTTDWLTAPTNTRFVGWSPTPPIAVDGGNGNNGSGSGNANYGDPNGGANAGPACGSNIVNPKTYKMKNTDTKLYACWCDNGVASCKNNGLITLDSADRFGDINNNPAGTGWKTSLTDNRNNNKGATSGCPTGTCRGFEMTQNIDLSTTKWGTAFTGSPSLKVDGGWEPIGNLQSATFEGNGFKIYGLYINRPGTPGAWGFFGKISAGVIRNLGIDNCFVRGDYGGGGDGVGGGSGALIGSMNGGAIYNTFANCNVYGNVNSGVLVGSNGGGAIYNSYTKGSASTNCINNGSYNVGAGGLNGSFTYGSNSSTPKLSNVFTLASANTYGSGCASYWAYSLGLGYRTNVTIKNSYATGKVTALNNIGFITNLEGTNFNITNSFWDKQTSKFSSSYGLLIPDSAGLTTLEMQSVGGVISGPSGLGDGYYYSQGHYPKVCLFEQVGTDACKNGLDEALVPGQDD